jgi:protein associated with RNAse G/E
MNYSSDNNDILDVQNNQNRSVKYDSDQELYNHLKNRGWQHQNTGANQRKYRYQGILLQMNTYELNSISLFINKTKRSFANTCQNEWLEEG